MGLDRMEKELAQRERQLSTLHSLRDNAYNKLENVREMWLSKVLSVMFCCVF